MLLKLFSINIVIHTFMFSAFPLNPPVSLLEKKKKKKKDGYEQNFLA